MPVQPALSDELNDLQARLLEQEALVSESEERVLVARRDAPAEEPKEWAALQRAIADRIRLRALLRKRSAEGTVPAG